MSEPPQDPNHRPLSPVILAGKTTVAVVLAVVVADCIAVADLVAVFDADFVAVVFPRFLDLFFIDFVVMMTFLFFLFLQVWIQFLPLLLLVLFFQAATESSQGQMLLLLLLLLLCIDVLLRFLYRLCQASAIVNAVEVTHLQTSVICYSLLLLFFCCVVLVPVTPCTIMSLLIVQLLLVEHVVVVVVIFSVVFVCFFVSLRRNK